MSDSKITQVQSAFALACSVEVNIRAGAPTIWNFLTDAPNFPRWNSTVAGIEGEIREGQKLVVRVPGETRSFTPKVSGVLANQRMTWTGGFAPMFLGVRTFELKPRGDASTDFIMRERFSGLMLPLIKRSLPDFGPIFERYAGDLKLAAERAEKQKS